MKRNQRVTIVLLFVSLITILAFQNCVKNPLVFMTNDSTGPSIELIEKPSKSAFQFAKFRFLATEIGTGKVDKYECSLDGSEFKICEPTIIYDNRKDAKILAHAVGEKKKLHTFKVRAYDDWGNVGETVIHQWEIDLEDFSFLIEPTEGMLTVTNKNIIPVNIYYNMKLKPGSDLLSNMIAFNQPGVKLVDQSLRKINEADILNKIIGKYEAQIEIPEGLEGGLEIKINENQVFNEIDKGNSLTKAILAFDRKAPESPVFDFFAPTPIAHTNGKNYTKYAQLNLKIGAINASHFSISNSIAQCNTSTSWQNLDPAFVTTGLNYTLPLLNQENILSVKYKDLVGNETSCLTTTVIHDNIAPVISALTDAGDFSISTISSIAFTFNTATDAHPFSQYTVSIGTHALDKKEVLQTAVPLSDYKLVNQNLLSNNRYYIWVSVTDVAGNTGIAQTDGWLVDNTPPTAPSNIVLGSIPQNLTTTPTISWTDATDINGSGIEKYQVTMIDNNNTSTYAFGWTDLVNGSYVQNINPKLISQNSYKVLVRAIDRAGNIGPATSMTSSPSYTSYNQPYLFQTQGINISRAIASDQYPSIVKMIHQEDGKKLLVGNFMQYSTDNGASFINNKIRLSATGQVQSQIFPHTIFFNSINSTFGNSVYDLKFTNIENSNDIWITGINDSPLTGIETGNIPTSTTYRNDMGFYPLSKSLGAVNPFTTTPISVFEKYPFATLSSKVEKIIKCGNNNDLSYSGYYSLGSNLWHNSFFTMREPDKPPTRIMKHSAKYADYTFFVDDTVSLNFTDIAVDSQCRLIIVGNFNTYKDPKTGITHNVSNIVRLKTDGGVDSTFDGGLQNNDSTSLKYVVVDNSDNIYVSQDDYNNFKLNSQSGGNGSTNTSNVIFKFNADGTPALNNFIDSGVHIGIGSVSRGVENSTKNHRLFIDQNGKLYHSRNYVNSGVSTFYSLIRLNTDGTVDSQFKCPDLKQSVTPFFTSSGIYLSGQFLYQFPDGKLISNILKVDNNCQPLPNTLGTGFSGVVTYLKELTNGDLILQGNIDMYNQKIAPGILRLNADLTIDSTFNPGKSFFAGPTNNHAIGKITNVARDELNKKYYLAGEFKNFNTTAINNLVRLNDNGSVDTTFNMNFGIYDKIGKGLTVSKNGNLYFNKLTMSDYIGKNIYKDGVEFINASKIPNSFENKIPFSKINDILIDSQNNIFIYGNNDLRRFSSSGQLEMLNFELTTTNFSTDSPVFISKLKLDSNDNLFFCFTSNKYNSYVNGTFSFGKLNRNGSVDNKNFKYDNSLSQCNDFDLSPSGKIVVSGYMPGINNNVVNILIYKSDGKIDPSFTVDDLTINQATLQFLGLDNVGNVSFITQPSQYKNDGKLLYNGPGLFLAP